MPKRYFVYILASKKNGTLYIGSTSDLIRRIHEHKNKVVPNSFTANHNINRLVFYEEHPNANSMIIRERRLKEWNRTWKIRVINELNPEWKDLSANIDN